MPLQDRDWRTLLHLHGELAERGSVDPLDGVDSVMETLYRMTESDEGFIMITRRARRAPAADPLDGWRPVRSMYNRRSEERARIAADWYSVPDRLTADIGARRLMETAGRTRVVLRGEVAASLGRGESMADAPLLAELGVRHRITAATPLSPGCEALLCLDRKAGTDFERAEKDLLQTTLSCLAWFFRRLPGAYDARRLDPRLSARQSETLRGLLTGRSEKAIAREMGITTGTLHQYVKSVYRKLDVGSRAELMARFVRLPGEQPSARVRHVVDHADASPRADFIALD